MGSLDGKVAIVTGASRGIGDTIARRLASEGAAVAVSARTVNPDEHDLPGTITSVAKAITDAGGRAIPVRCDLSKPKDRKNLIETTEKELGPVDILVNNAAVTYFLPTADFPEKRYRLMLEVQVRAPFELAQLVLPGMRERGQGWILNISSKAAIHPQGPPFQTRRAGAGTVYGMCKAALERFTTGLASEVWEDNIAVNVLSPTQVVATPGVLHHRLIPEGQEDRAEGTEVMAEAALTLVSGDPKELTGRIAYSQEICEEFGRTPVKV